MKKFLSALLLASVSFAAESDNFRLSMDNVRGTVAALKGLAETLSADPALYERFKLAKKQLKGDTNGRDALSMTAEAVIAREPKIAAVYRKAGVTPKVAGMTMETIAGAALGVAMMEQAGSKAKLPQGFVADNVEFYKQNKEAIHTALNELKSVSGKLPADDDGEDSGDDEDSDDDKS